MSKNSKKKEKKLQKLEKARAFNQQFQRADLIEGTIPSQAGNFLSTSLALNNELDEKFVSGQNYILIFDYYNNNCCELSDLKQAQAKGLIKKFQIITSISPAELPSSRLVRDNITRSGDSEYSKLSQTITPDVEIKETELPGRGRMFFYLVDRYFCILAIKAKHTNTH